MAVRPISSGEGRTASSTSNAEVAAVARDRERQRRHGGVGLAALPVGGEAVDVPVARRREVELAVRRRARLGEEELEAGVLPEAVGAARRRGGGRAARGPRGRRAGRSAPASRPRSRRTSPVSARSPCGSCRREPHEVRSATAARAGAPPSSRTYSATAFSFSSPSLKAGICWKPARFLPGLSAQTAIPRGLPA